jgi:hypothetical protein
VRGNHSLHTDGARHGRALTRECAAVAWAC